MNLDLNEVAVLRRALAGALLNPQPATASHDLAGPASNPDAQTIFAMIADLDRLLGRQRSPRHRMLPPTTVVAAVSEISPPRPRLVRNGAPGG